MALCAVLIPNATSGNSIQINTQPPCDFYLVESKDLEGQLTGSDVALLFSACASLYALVFVFKLARRLLGF